MRLGAKKLKDTIPTLNLGDEVKIERSVFKMTSQEEKKDIQLENAERSYLASTSEYVMLHGIWGDYEEDEGSDLDIEQLDNPLK